MSKLSKNVPLDQATHRTERDLQLASLIYPILIDLAINRTVMTYAELVAAVQAANPNDSFAASMRPVQCGRFLGVIYNFAESQGLPRISALIINKGKGDCGKGLSDSHDCDAERATCYAYDWSLVLPQFWTFIKTSKAALVAARRLKKVPADKARQIRYSYFSTNRASFIPNIEEFEEDILNALMSGVAAEVAFAQYLR
jgi:hypothetical protein